MSADPVPHGAVSESRWAVRYSLDLLEPRDRRRFRQVVTAQMISSILDLLGVLLLGVVGLLAGYAASGQGLPGPAAEGAARLGLEDWSVEGLAALAAAAATCLLLFKSVVTAVLMRRAVRILAAGQVSVVRRVTRQLLSMPFFAFQKGTSHEVTWTLGLGLYLTLGALLGSYAVVLSEMALLAVLVLAMAIVSPTMTLVSILYFAVVAVVLHRILGRWSHRIEGDLAKTYVGGQRSIQESLQLLPELLVSNRRQLYEDRIADSLSANAIALADQAYVAQLPKLVYEAALVVGMVGLAGWQLANGDLASVIGVLAVFLAAGTRLLPALIRLQNAVVAVRARSANTQRVRAVLESLSAYSVTETVPFEATAFRVGVTTGHEGFDPVVDMSAVCLRYPHGQEQALQGVDLQISPGEVVAIVGPTGAGKSSLAGVLLGIFDPSSGKVTIGGVGARAAVEQWPGAIAYVPQHIALVHGTVRDNVALGLPVDLVDDDRVWGALEAACLSDFLSDSREGLDTPIGEHGSHLSGGQRQRLGLARALYSNPRLLVLDEATSALDAHTETLVTEALLRLRGRITVIAIAHRDATMRIADQVVYMEGGSVRAAGTYNFMRESVREFRDMIRTLDIRSSGEVMPQEVSSGTN